MAVLYGTRKLDRHLQKLPDNVLQSPPKTSVETTSRNQVTNLIRYNLAYSPLVPWHQSLIPPLKFNVKVNNQNVEVIYDNSLPYSIGSISLLRRLKGKWEVLPQPKNIPISSNCSKYEASQSRICLRLEANELELPWTVFCATTNWQHLNLYLGRDFGQQYIRLVCLKENLVTLSDGKTNARCSFHLMRPKKETSTETSTRVQWSQSS